MEIIFDIKVSHTKSHTKNLIPKSVFLFFCDSAHSYKKSLTTSANNLTYLPDHRRRVYGHVTYLHSYSMVNVSGMLRSTLRLIDKCSESEQSCASNFWHVISEKFVKLLMSVISNTSPLSNSKILPDLQTLKKWFFNTPNILVYDNGQYKDMVQVVTVSSLCRELQQSQR